MDKAMDMFDSINNSSILKQFKMAFNVLKCIKDFLQDLGLYFFGMFLADSLFMLVASYMSPNRAMDTGSTIQFK